MPSFLSNHFHLTDFTQFHDEIRMVSDDFMVGKYVMDLPPGIASLFPAVSMGLAACGYRRRKTLWLLLHAHAHRPQGHCRLAVSCAPFLNVHLPAGLGMTFDEEMVGWYWPGQFAGEPGRDADLAIADRVPREGKPDGAGACSFRLRLTVRDLNEFIEGAAHEAQPSGTISFENFEGQPGTYTVDERRSRFQYLAVNDQTGEAEMRYYLEFADPQGGRRFLFDGRKYMQKDEAIGRRGISEVRDDYTTLFCHVYELGADGTEGTRHRIPEVQDLRRSRRIPQLTDFLRSFKITGTSDPLLQFQAQMRFLAFTAQFVLREYDPIAPEPASLAPDVRDEVLRNADTPDYFSTRSSAELQAALRASSTLPLESLINTGSVRIDFEKAAHLPRLFLERFVRCRHAARVGGARAQQRLRSGWREERCHLHRRQFLEAVRRHRQRRSLRPCRQLRTRFHSGLPEVRRVQYPDANRAYFNKGDDLLLLTYKNQPYRIVYDTIKVIDEDSALGVMHLGDFPNGVEFASFVMERHNYPFEKMSIADHHAIFADPRTRVPRPDELAW
jgi:hypothetical protein